MEGLQRYQIMEPLGSGGQGTTFRAIDRSSGKECAVKVLRLKEQSEWKGFELFERECETLASLDHPGIPQFLDRYASETSGDYFLVMELLPGQSLQHHLDEVGPLPEARLWKILGQALPILEYLHQRSPAVIHRDVKPANLMLSPDGKKLSLVDFGGVRRALRAGGGSTMIGTFGFMAPEQLHGDASPATDIYALGATLATLATGVPADELPHAGLAVDLTSLNLPPKLRALLAQMLAPDPGDRLADVAAVRAWLRGPTTAPIAALRTRADGTESKSEALAEIPEEVRELAEVRSAFWGFFLWMFSAAAAGFLAVLEALFIPLTYSLVRAFSRRKKRDNEAELADQQRDVASSVRRSRKAMQYLAETHSPFGDS